MEEQTRREVAKGKGQDTRRQILAATERIIHERGLARVTTKEIAREAGYAEGTLYKHFADKEDLFLSVIRENLPSFTRVMQEHRAGTQTVRANLEEIGQAALVYYGELIPLAASFLADTELLASYRRILDEIQGGPMRLYERMAEYIAEEQQLGRIDPQIDPMSATTLLLGSCFQFAFYRHFLGSDPLPITTQQYVAGLVGALMAGLEPKRLD